MATANHSQIIRFGLFEVDLRAGELRKNGVKLRLQQQPFQVLMALLERPGEVVTRDELHDRLWPDDTYVDFEHGLNAAVKRLRDALGESAERPVFIETLSRRGYRFIAVNGFQKPTATGEAVAETTSPPPKAHSKYLWFLIPAFLMLWVVGSLFWLLSRPKPPAESMEVPLTMNSQDNRVTGAVISPDGRYLAYSDAGGLYLKLLSSGETHLLALPKGFVGSPVAWFPNAAHLLLAGGQAPDPAKGLWNISINGGSPQKLVDSALDASISPDGSHIAYTRSDWKYAGNEIWIVNSDGTNPVNFVPAVMNNELGSVKWAPDSKHLAYIRLQWGGYFMRTNSIETISVSDKEPHTLMSDPAIGDSLYWLADGRLVYTIVEGPFSTRDSNALIVGVKNWTRMSGTPTHLTHSPGWISEISATADSKHICFLKTEWSSHVVLGRLSPDLNRLLEVRPLTQQQTSDIPSSWTSDSKAVLFSSDRNGHFEIFKQALDEKLPETVVSNNQEALLPRLSPDGSELVYETHGQRAPNNAEASLMAAPVGGGVPRTVVGLPDSRGLVNTECTRSPETFCVFDVHQGTRTTFFRVNPKTREHSQITLLDTNAAMNWGLSPDGSQLAMLQYTPGGHTVQLYSLADLKPRALDVKGYTGLMTIDWASDSKSMFIGIEDYVGRSGLIHVDMDGNAHYLGDGYHWAIPSPDGKWIAINKPSSTGNAWLVDIHP